MSLDKTSPDQRSLRTYLTPILNPNVPYSSSSHGEAPQSPVRALGSRFRPSFSRAPARDAARGATRAYVLDNYRRHADATAPRLPLSFLDPCSSAASFD